MLRKVLVLAGGILSFLWGASHLIPTSAIANGAYGVLSINNKNIMLMEWINEGFTLIFIGLLVVIAGIINKDKTDKTSKLIFILSPVMLFSMAILSLFTGYHIDFLPFKLCPYIFSLSGILILQGSFRR
jgi:hypothetical protein